MARKNSKDKIVAQDSSETTRLQPNDARKLGNVPKKVTQEFIHEHNSRMQTLYQAARDRRSKRGIKLYPEPEDLLDAIDAYIDLTVQNDLFPTEAGLIVFLGVHPSWYYAILRTPNDERANILEIFRCFISEHANQAGLSGTSNTIFTIYYLKSRMGQWDSPNEQTININMSNSTTFTFDGDNNDLKNLVDSTPIIEAPCKEMPNKAISSSSAVKSMDFAKTD